MKILVAVGTRPNIIKAAPIIKELEKQNINYNLIHTGQHYDYNMSLVFYEEFGLKNKGINLNVNNSSVNDIRSAFSTTCLLEKPDIVIVIGDVNSTLGCTLAAKSYGCKIAHVESGERSFDPFMVEEKNRILIDLMSDYLFCSNNNAAKNLYDKNYNGSKVFVVGNVAIDSLLCKYEQIKNINFRRNKNYILVTIHRQENTDNKCNLENILNALNKLSESFEIVFPLHPRTKLRTHEFELQNKLGKLVVAFPLSYTNFLIALKDSKFLITDSGGAQVEAAVFNIPCITTREKTEHIFTVDNGVNYLAGANEEKILEYANKIITEGNKNKVTDPLWDGKVAERIVNILIKESINDGRYSN